VKQRLSISDVETLTPSQQTSLRRIWLPERYDIAVSQVCIDVERDEYKWLEFAVGDMVIRKDGELVLKDLRLTDGYVKILDSESEDAEEFQLQEPTSFSKSDTLPLLTIGQMFTMLYMLDKSKYHFYLLTGNNKHTCEIGDFNSKLKPEILSKNDKLDELLDVLWSTLKMIL
jgi:hypothetical protein